MASEDMVEPNSEACVDSKAADALKKIATAEVVTSIKKSGKE